MATGEQEPYCWNCGASNADSESIVTVGYRAGGGNSFVSEGRPHCDDCAKDHTSFTSKAKVIGLTLVILVLLYIIKHELVDAARY